MKISSEFLQKLRKILLNKYAILSIVFFAVITFSGSYSLINRYKRGRAIKSLQKEIKFYKTEIEDNKSKMQEMTSSDENLEKYGREKFYLKKDSEDIYIIKEEDEK